MHIAFCINRLALAGLGVTIASLVRNCSDTTRLTLWFLCAGLTGKEKDRIERLLKVEQFSGQYRFVDFDPVATFGSFNPLHGDWTPYGRLLLADLVPVDQVLYLDADLMVELDVLQVENFDFGGHALAAVGGGRFKYALGCKFYIERLRLSPDWEYFNSGVLLFNLREWRSKKLKEQCLAIARQYPMELPSHDQSLLNMICAGTFAKLPPAFNCEWIADQPRPATADKMIVHFVGSPKPWDPLGSLLHNGYRAWMNYLDPAWASDFIRLSFKNIGRTWQIRRSYVRCLRNKIRQ